MHVPSNFHHRVALGIDRGLAERSRLFHRLLASARARLVR